MQCFLGGNEWGTMWFYGVGLNLIGATLSPNVWNNNVWFLHTGVANNIPINVLQSEEKGHLLQSPKYSTHLHYLCSLHPK